jgi:aminoglycoside phosphotransferase (APT) family kinase protein
VTGRIAGDAALSASELAPFFAERRAGAGYREALEHLLLGLPLERAELLMQRLREGRAAFLPMLGTDRGRVLLIGDACSGSALALGRTPFALIAVDSCPARLAFAAERDRALAGGRSAFVRADPGRRLPFADQAFDLVIDERGALCPSELAELARVARGEVVGVLDNRLAYKLSSGVRADFRRLGPLSLLTRAIRPPRGERTLRGWRRALSEAGLASTDALALYPHRLDFSHVVGIDRPAPKLTVGPMERQNPLKIVGQRMGLFPLLTPSFALRAARRGTPAAWIDGVLEQVASHLGTRTPALEHLIATRGNTCVLLTRDPDWCLHLPLSPAQERQSRRHFQALRSLEKLHPSFPAPRPLWEGEPSGRYLCVESRLGGLSAPQLSGDLRAAARTYADCAAAFAGLTAVPPRALDPETIERLVDLKLAAVAPRTGDAPTTDRLESLAAGLREVLGRTSIPLVLYHADLRAKHVQVARDGSLLGVMDFGSHEATDLPLFDLLNLIVHDRKQRTAGWTIGDAWRLARSGLLEGFERASIDDYATRLGLPDDYVRAVIEAMPLLIGAMAESNWDYSRPRWVRRSFGLEG